MSPKLKTLSGEEVVAILEKFGFERKSQRGSHIKLFRKGKTGTREILAVPVHKELDKGTLRAIFRQASRFVPEEELYKHFYHK
jgi:predicted RNA binding protein YcfA (HicA-like mRNA interferase family)